MCFAVTVNLEVSFVLRRDLLTLFVHAVARGPWKLVRKHSNDFIWQAQCWVTWDYDFARHLQHLIMLQCW